jgi:hypothetical protein
MVTADDMVAAGDVNGDGKPDVVAANSETAGEIQVLLSTGHGAFAAPIRYPVGSTFKTQPIITDLNGDGKLDIAIAANGANVLLNAGDGTFAATALYGSSLALAVGDLDNNGSPDLLAGGSVFLNDGTGRFVGPIESAISGSAIADVDDDHKNDLIFFVNESFNAKYGVARGLGNGMFAPPVTVNMSFGASALAVGDVTGDGKPDLVFPNGSNTVYIYANLGDGRYGWRRGAGTS